MTDFRALCAELLHAVQSFLLFTDVDTTTADQRARRVDVAMNAVRAALAQPAPPAEGEVGDEELPPRVGHILRLAEIIRAVDGSHDKGAAALAEAILNHPDICSAGLAADLLEQHHPTPVPVSERLRYLQAGIKYGYQAGHEDTVEACFGDSSSFAEEMAPEILAEIESDALPLPAGEVQP